MSRIEKVFETLQKRSRAALIPFVVAGDPDLEMTEVLVRKISTSGADIIELGVPFSDPLADGPTIQEASQRALAGGVTLERIFSLGKRLTDLASPLVLMTYYNPVFRFGLRDFAKECRESGISGVIIPDLPPEEAGPWIHEARAGKVDTIFLIAPTSPPERIQSVGKVARGFIYYVSVTGVTGIREKLPEELKAAVEQVKEQSRKPVAVGFGISTPEQAKEIAGFADGVIVGSALVKIIEKGGEGEEMLERVGRFISSLASVL